MSVIFKWFVIITGPKVVGLASLFFLLVTLVFDGTLFSVYRLYRQQDKLVSDISALEAEAKNLKKRLKSVKHPKALARQAHKRFDLVTKDDLIFIFTD